MPDNPQHLTRFDHDGARVHGDAAADVLTSVSVLSDAIDGLDGLTDRECDAVDTVVGAAGAWAQLMAMWDDPDNADDLNGDDVVDRWLRPRRAARRGAGVRAGVILRTRFGGFPVGPVDTGRMHWVSEAPVNGVSVSWFDA